MSNHLKPEYPSRNEIEEKLEDLLNGVISREEAADWAIQWIINDKEISDTFDKAIWDALNELAGADSKTIDRPYLYNEEDFIYWLNKFKNQVKGESMDGNTE